MIELDETVFVDRPPEAVFAHLADIAALPDWLPGVRGAMLVDGGPPRPGSRIRLAIDGPTGPIEAIGQIEEFQPPERLGFRTVDAPVGLQSRVDLQPDGSGTRLRIRARVELSGMFRFAEGMVRRRIDKERPAALADLQRRLEGAIPSSG